MRFPSLQLLLLLSVACAFASASFIVAQQPVSTTTSTTTTTVAPSPDDGDDTEDPWQKTQTYRIFLIIVAAICGGSIAAVILLDLAKLRIEGSTGGYKSRQTYMTRGSSSGGSQADYSEYVDENNNNQSVNSKKGSNVSEVLPTPRQSASV